MTNFFNWLKRNWQLLVIVFLVYLLIKNKNLLPYSTNYYQKTDTYYPESVGAPLTKEKISLPVSGGGGPAPGLEVKGGLVVKNSWLSLLVKNVRLAANKIIKKVEALGGFLVDSQIDSVEGIDTGTVTLRIPAKKLDEALTFIRSQGTRVVSEYLQGYDVTDEYIDIQARLESLNKTKAKYEELLAKATKVSEIVEIQRELTSLQEQIDRLKGQEQYLTKNAQNAKITVYLSSDELALPYTPTKPWEPKVIFKQAVRSLISTLRSIGTIIIWLFVYSVLWLPLLFLFIFLKRKKRI